MSHSRPRPRRRRTRSVFLTILLVVAALTGLVGCRSLIGSASGGSSGVVDRRASLGVAGGELPDGVTVFDEYPGVTNLDPALLDALRTATTDARADGIGLDVNSGWRSRAHQEELLEEAVAQHGSRAEAARWVATPSTSPHVSGDAVDVGGADATTWLAEHGAEYGLCQIYLNEPWHYELRPDAVDHGCPAMYADPTRDPRMQQ
jgi:zinc D-Ala-D-Ala carboxypeptidase